MKDGRKVLGSTLLGLVIGAIAGVLFAPKSGKETREDIKNKAKEAKDKTEEAYKKAKKETGKVYYKAKDVAGDVADTVEKESKKISKKMKQ